MYIFIILSGKIIYFRRHVKKWQRLSRLNITMYNFILNKISDLCINFTSSVETRLEYQVVDIHK